MKGTETATPSRGPWLRRAPAHSWRVGIGALVLIGIAVRLQTLPLTPDVEDSVLFVRGVVRHSIAEMRPHWPGYAVYIWVGKLFTAATGDPVVGLHLVSALASALTAWPLAFVTRAWALSLGAPESTGRWCGWATAALWLASPMAWVTGSQIVSDPLGLLCGATVLALCVAGERKGSGLWVVAALLGGLMAGVRLVNVTMLGPLAMECWRRRHERWRDRPVPLVLLAAGVAGVLPWLLWLVVRDPVALLYGGRAHLGGHFKGWGESLWTDRHPLTRPFRALHTLAVYGLGAGTSDRLGVFVSGAWLATLGMATFRRRWQSPVSRLIGLWAVPHLLYVFVAHDVDYPRYALSAVALLSVVGGLAPLRFGRAGTAAVIAAVAAMAVVSEPLAAQQRRQPPVEVRAARFLAARPHAAVVVVEHPALAFFLEAADAGIVTTEAAAEDAPRWAAAWASHGREVFANEPPPQDPAGWVPVAHFCRDPRINRYLSHDLWLFAPVSSALARAGPVTACDER
jgi:hypothetical protein